MSRRGQEGRFVYSAWYYLPRREVPTEDMWNVFQFKSDSPTVVSIGTDPFWTINIVRSRRGPLRLVLKWKGGLTDHTQGVSGPFADSPIAGPDLPPKPYGCSYSAVVQDQRLPQPVRSVRRTFGRAPERRPALGHAACSHEVSGWKAELERRKLLQRHSRRPSHDLHRRRESSEALKGSRASSTHSDGLGRGQPSGVRALLDHLHACCRR